MKREDKQNLLVSKMQKEFDEFRMETLKLPKEQMFDKAYEISSKEDIRGYVESEELSPRQLDVLLSKENSIDTMYMAWLKTDTYHPDLINIIERNIDELSKGGYVSSDMQPTVDWLGELNDIRRFSYLDVNRWFETVELITALVYSISYRGLITGNFAAGNNRTRQNIRTVN